jgi:hypothetical protein
VVPGLVVAAGASSGPGSSGIPSGPGALAAAELVLVLEERGVTPTGPEELAVVVALAELVVALAELVLAELAPAALDEVEELLPQPAAASAPALISATIQIRGVMGAER